MNGWTYRRAGVDISKIKQSHGALRDIFSQTLKYRTGFGSVFRGAGHYAGLLRIGGEKLLAIHTDGVGTKVLIAGMMKKFDTVGIDCVAMNVNDIVCTGAEPFAMVNYLALREPNKSLIVEISKGLAKGAEAARIAIVGGETAVVPDLLAGNEKSFDIAGTGVGCVDENNLILGQRLKGGDAIIGIESSGIHSNGLTLARKILLAKHNLDEELPGTKLEIGKELLKPTRIYCRQILSLIEDGFKISGLAHVTGGGFTKLQRISPSNRVGFSLESMPPPPAIFDFIQREGRVPKKEMYKTFNMGVGFCVMTPQSEVRNVIEALHKGNLHSSIVGRVVGEPGVFLDKKPLQ